MDVQVSDADFEVETSGQPPDPEPESVVTEPAATEPEHELEPAAAVVAEPAKKAKPRDNPQARISQAIAKQKDAERKVQTLEQELAELRVSHASPAVSAAVPVPDAPRPVATRAKPTEDQVGTKYQTYGDYVEDLADWKAEQRLAAFNLDAVVTSKLSEREEQQRQRTVGQAHQTRVLEAQQKYADYDTAVAQTDTLLGELKIPFSDAFRVAVVESDASGDLLYWLATHPTELIQLARDSQSLDVAAAPWIRRELEARLGAGVRPGSAQSAMSTARRPIKPVGASPVTPVDDDDELPIEEYFKRANARDRKAGKL